MTGAAATNKAIAKIMASNFTTKPVNLPRMKKEGYRKKTKKVKKRKK